MRIFDFFKPQKKPLNEFVESMTNSMFPKGKKDIQAGTNELLFILNNKIDYNTAEGIFVRSTALSRISKEFDRERLRSHLSGYCIEHFDNSQIDKYFDYLTALSFAMILNNRTPSEVRREGSIYVW